MFGTIVNYVCKILKPTPDEAVKNQEVREIMEKAKTSWIDFI